MSRVREVVTLQLGHYAGSVGAHWWGLQEALFLSNSPASSLDEGIHHDVLFRTGKTLQGRETFTPRLILMDLKGSLTTLKQEGYLYEDTKTNIPVAWKGTLTTHQQDPVPPSPILEARDQPEGHKPPGSDVASQTPPGGKQLPPAKPLASEGPAPTWSDFLRTPLHPRSVLTIREYNSEEEPGRLEAYGQGEKLLQEGTYLEDLEDRLHFYVEECDYLQGFQVLCDLHNGFSGVGAKAVELLQDEYVGKGILTCGLTPVLQSSIPQRNFYRLMNTVLGIVHLASQSSLFCPLSLNGSLGLKPEAPLALPHLHYKASLDYHTSAILATALDTLTTPYRLQTSAISVSNLAETVNFSGRKVAEAVAAIPFPVAEDQSLPDALCSQQPSTVWSSLSSCGSHGDAHCFAQSVVLRGIGKQQQVSNTPPGTEPKSVLHVCETGQEVLTRYLYMVSPETLSTSLLLQGPCKLLAPYPQFFSPFLNKHGFLAEKPLYAPAKVDSIPVLAAFRSSAGLCRTLGDLYRALRRMDLRRWASFFSAGVEMEDLQEALDELRTLSHCYQKDHSADDSDEDAD
ncbi:protein misato homolog 1 isoform X1 [Candoia aspera]|uniref:protein misato homolog 1 isoform X1 n=1 Tax=Candoia aspera TaxID=51853 RepID=UPI002FD8563D